MASTLPRVFSITDVRQAEWQTWRAALTPPDLRPGQPVLAACGVALFQALLAGDVRDLWLSVRADLGDVVTSPGCVCGCKQPAPPSPTCPGNPLRRRPRPHAGGEHAHDVGARGPLAALCRRRDPLQLTLPLHLLLAIPEDPTGQIDAAAEEALDLAVLAPLHPDGVTWETLTGRFNALDLRQRVPERGGFDVLHLITHGTAEGVLLWENDEAVIAPAAALRVALEAAPWVRVAVLNACETRDWRRRRAGDQCGRTPVQAGLPAVVAMQVPIADQAAATFAEHFYAEACSRGAAPVRSTWQ